MKVKILKKTKNELKIEIDGEGHTFCNVVQKALLKNKKVDLAGYNIPHPLTANPVVYLRTKTQSKPEIVLRNAVKEVQKDTEAFRVAFDKALKEWQS
ncbi:MAG: DNA-directed RNA polymerase subunit L [Candidatus Bathyarchaeota archaeon]|nr:DNA-directed RNA polymerase subunit L [Candidatus Bathyarchaeota archaeon]MDH5494203.1 DNA-directed RNA polymerase subunit L [Candidatus Bathyarchaeota archaeon]